MFSGEFLTCFFQELCVQMHVHKMRFEWNCPLEEHYLVWNGKQNGQANMVNY